MPSILCDNPYCANPKFIIGVKNAEYMYLCNQCLFDLEKVNRDIKKFNDKLKDNEKKWSFVKVAS